MVLCSDSDILEVITTKDIIKDLLPKKYEKIIYTNKIFIFVFKKARNKFINKNIYFLSLKYIYVRITNILIMVIVP
jgi:predicted neutral ceramidase superfamily lipid hydrolase